MGEDDPQPVKRKISPPDHRENRKKSSLCSDLERSDKTLHHSENFYSIWSRAKQTMAKGNNMIPRIYRIREGTQREGSFQWFAYITKISGDIISYTIGYPFNGILTFHTEDTHERNRENFFQLFRNLRGREKHYKVRLID